VVPWLRGAGRPRHFSTSYTGDGTYYGTADGGSCRLDGAHKPSWVTSAVVPVAINAPQYSGAQTCGLCLRVNSTSGQPSTNGLNPISAFSPFTAFVDDKCPECHTGDLDLGKVGDGRWKISWTAVDCPVGDSKIKYFFEGTNAYYVKVQPAGTMLPLTKVELKVGSTWKTATLSADNFWIASGISPALTLTNPLKVRLTSVANEILVDNIKYVSTTNDVRSTGMGSNSPHLSALARLAHHQDRVAVAAVRVALVRA